VEAFTWACGFALNASDTPPAVAVSVAESWARKDMNGSLDWLLAHPEIGKDAGIFGLARAMAAKDLTEAMGMAATIKDPIMRARLEFQLRGIADQSLGKKK
jgi:hypothetical protein